MIWHHKALWNFSISQQLCKKIESVQKACLFIVLGRHATPDYYCNLAMLNLEPMANRREKLCKKFARKTLKHPVHGKMFTINQNNQTRSGRKVIEPQAKSARYRKSSIPSLARMLNSSWISVFVSLTLLEIYTQRGRDYVYNSNVTLVKSNMLNGRTTIISSSRLHTQDQLDGGPRFILFWYCN